MFGSDKEPWFVKLIRSKWFIPLLMAFAFLAPAYPIILNSMNDGDCARVCRSFKYDTGKAEPCPNEGVLCACFKSHQPAKFLYLKEMPEE